jgi:prolyl-tRNA synthetase
MKWSDYYLPTLKENPKEAEAQSHKLMIRAGLIRKLAAGTYSYLPFGLRALNNVKAIIRQAMNEKGALEVFLPALHPFEIWQKTGRDVTLIDDVGYSFTDRHGNKMVLGPTHEEIITTLIQGEIKSYKQMPLILYQIQSKFRDEPRPRFGVIRSKEFIMKDAYSFDADEKSLNESYKKMQEAYCKILDECGLDYIIVEADPGMMGGKESAEFMVISDSGEDMIVKCLECDYAASLEAAPSVTSEVKNKEKALAIEEIITTGKTTVEGVCRFMKVPEASLIKTLIYKTDDNFIAVLIRGDKRLNEAKLAKALGVGQLTLANDKEIKNITGGPVGFSGPVGLKGVKIIADALVKNIPNAIVGANKKDKHFKNVNLKRDFKVDAFHDLRYADIDDVCPKCGKQIEIKRTMEVGHIFKLGTKYTESLNAKFLDKNGKEQPIIMGCYGIGVNRVLAAIIELNHDEKGIIWPQAITPFKAQILLLDESKEAISIADNIYDGLIAEGFDVLYDDRNIQAGVKFKDADLIGIPLQIIIGSRGLEKGNIEIKYRHNNKKEEVAIKNAVSHLKKILTM